MNNNFLYFIFNFLFYFGVWPSGLGRHVRDVEVGGSNPLTPTKNTK